MITIKRRDLLKGIGLGALCTAVPAFSGASTKENPKGFYVYVGTYTRGESEGIYVYWLDMPSGKLEYRNKATGIDNPSFLVIEPKHRYLYAVNEISNFEGKRGGAVSAFSIDQQSAGLKLINQQPTHGGAPCYVTTDNESEWILTANYSGGNAAVFPVENGGWVGPESDLVRHQGSSVNERRQKSPHPHCIILDAANRYAFVPDLGMDKVMIYKFDSAEGKLIPNEVPFFQTKPGAGPRHMTFHPNGKFAFVIQELNSTITSLAYDASVGSLEEIQTESTIPQDFEGENWCADIHVSPSGKFLYGSNRGHNSIVIFKIDETSGELEFVGRESTRGETPRNFAIDPTGKYLLAANQNTNNVFTFHIDPDTGKLEPTGHSADIPSPVCLKLIPDFESKVQKYSLYSAILNRFI